ncbi:MAG: hypothetical protein J5687_00340 [Treponema sp.]|nr:hypothetical protein [Treponema sp.]
MKLFYNPGFSDKAYIDFKKDSVRFDSKITGTAGLCEIIRLHAGVCSNVNDYGTRFVHYYAAMKKYMAKNPGNILEESFKVDMLNTAKKCLEWRDTLAAAGWTKETSWPSERMQVLSGVEQYFNEKSFGEELLEIIDLVEGGCMLPELEIETSEDYKSFNPAEVHLLDALKNRGIKISFEPKEALNNNIEKIFSVMKGTKGIKLDPNDDSFEIWNFDERDDAVKYLSHLDDNAFDVWINLDNKEFDNWQKLEGHKLSGSESKGIPQVVQLLNIGLTIFERPLNIHNLVEWLNTSVNPLSDFFRKQLAKIICDTGGYYNDKCQKFISSQLEKYPDIKEKLEQFLPDINKPYFEESVLEKKDIQDFILNVRNWCAKTLGMSKDENPELSQLTYVINQADSLLMLLDEYGKNQIPYSDIELMTSVFACDITMKQYSAQAGCKTVINSTADFCDVAQKTVWCDFYECGNAGKLTYSFLSPAETAAFKKDLSLWEPEQERAYLRNSLLTPFAKTKEKLVLVTINNIDSSPVPKSPLYIQLEQYFADKKEPNDFSKNLLFPFVKQMSLDQSLYKNARIIDNRVEPDQQFIEVENVGYIKNNWPVYQSYSSLEKLIPHPLDFVIDKFADFSSNPVSSIKDAATTTGLVAHKIIQVLFGPNEQDKDSGTPEYIRNQIDKRFDEVFQQTVQSEGAILLVKENRLELQKFKKQMKNCLEELLEAIKQNDLHVVACENNYGFETDREGNIIKHGKIGNLDITAKIDMVLEDSNGNPYVFDFKWSSSKRYAEMLEENKSVQLTLYKELVSKEMKVPVKAVAYFLMPQAKFISCNDFEGAINFQQVRQNPERKIKNLLKEIQNSYDYRMKEILEGKLEETTGWAEEDITYEQQREDQGLMPMDYYNNVKNGPYDDIGLLKGRK